MLVGQEQTALPFSRMGLAFSPTVYLHMLPMPSIVTGKGLKLLVALASLEGQPYWFRLTLVSIHFHFN
jgi:hypothetical protein